MPCIELKTIIHAPPERVFDLSRSIDLHVHSTEGTKEQAVAGVTSGLIDVGEQVTWRAFHFGFWHRLTSRITAFEYPHRFVDEMQEGIFKRMHHTHAFEACASGTCMYDVFDYTAPLGVLGKLADFLFLKAYMRRFLVKRNAVIKAVAESERWQEFLVS